MRLSLIDSDGLYSDEDLIKYNKNIESKLVDICKPLSSEIRFNCFEYHRFFDDHSFFYVSTNSEWHEVYVQNYARSSLVKNHIKNVFNENIRYYSLIYDSNNKELFDFIKSIKSHRMHNFFYIYIHYKDSIEVFSFATQMPNNYFINTCFNNLDILYRFITYFSEKAGDIINISNAKELLYPEKGFLIKNSIDLSKQEKKVKKFLENTEIKKYPIVIENNIVYLTQRQLQCVFFLSRGRAYKEIGELLGVGGKCVENHLTTAKLKLGCVSNSCLIKIFENNHTLNNMLLFIGGI